MKKILLFVSILGICALALAACGTGASASGSSGSNVVTVKTGSTNFLQSSVTLNKGDTLQIVNTASDIHLISLGTWNNGTPVPEKEPGAPNVKNEEVPPNGTLNIGPFNTPGTYHLYCTVHQNMKLTVVVK